MGIVIVRDRARYHQTLTKLGQIRAMRIELLVAVRDLCARDCNPRCDGACVVAFRNVLVLMRTTFLKEDKFLKFCGHSNRIHHGQEHQAIQREVLDFFTEMLKAGAAPQPLDVVHAFDAYLIHHFGTDEPDYSDLQVRTPGWVPVPGHD